MIGVELLNIAELRGIEKRGPVDSRVPLLFQLLHGSTPVTLYRRSSLSTRNSYPLSNFGFEVHDGRAARRRLRIDAR